VINRIYYSPRIILHAVLDFFVGDVSKCNIIEMKIMRLTCQKVKESGRGVNLVYIIAIDTLIKQS
jgi:hypothetical protein